jgi:hypothetical protein
MQLRPSAITGLKINAFRYGFCPVAPVQDVTSQIP